MLYHYLLLALLYHTRRAAGLGLGLARVRTNSSLSYL